MGNLRHRKGNVLYDLTDQRPFEATFPQTKISLLKMLDVHFLLYSPGIKEKISQAIILGYAQNKLQYVLHVQYMLRMLKYS